MWGVSFCHLQPCWQHPVKIYDSKHCDQLAELEASLLCPVVFELPALPGCSQREGWRRCWENDGTEGALGSSWSCVHLWCL